MNTGMRVNQLAKELGVESKLILLRCRAEGLGDRVPNHMSVLSQSLTETLRHWFGGRQSVGHTPESTPQPQIMSSTPIPDPQPPIATGAKSTGEEEIQSRGETPRDVRLRVLRDLERIVGRVDNGNIQNYAPGGIWEGEGRLFNYHAVHTTQTGRCIKAGTAEARSSIDRQINGSRPTEAVLMSGTYHFGANQMPVYRNLDAVLRYLEQHFGLRLDESRP